MYRFLAFILSIGLQACSTINSKAIDYREVEVIKPSNRLLVGDNWNNLYVTQAETIKPINKPRHDWFYDK